MVGPPSSPLILHIISGLGTGGAEMMLYRLTTNASKVRHCIVSLRDLGTIGPRMQSAGVPVTALNLHHLRNLPAAVFRLRRLVAELQPDVIQGWMTHGNLAATWATAATGVPLVWNVRQSLVDLRYEKPATRAVLAMTVRLSHRPRAIIYNSAAGAAQHEAIGYPPARRLFIPNGFDTQRLRPDDALRAETRARLGIDADDVLVGMIGRFHPMKNHNGFIDVMQRLAGRHPRLRGLLAGTGTDGPELARRVGDAGLDDRILRLGDRSDMPDLMRALDILVSPSVHGEGFPNVIGEAMASGVPCVASDVGDSARVVGDAGTVVPVNDPDATAVAIRQLLELTHDDREALGQRARRRIVAEFGIDRIVARYEGAYLDVLGARS